MGYVEDLRDKIKALEINNDIKEAEIQLLLNQSLDVTKPSMYLMLANLSLFDMLFENKQFQIKNGATKKAKESEQRLNNLLDYIKVFDEICSQNYSLKNYNRDILAKNMLLRVEIADLKKQVATYNQTMQEL